VLSAYLVTFAPDDARTVTLFGVVLHGFGKDPEAIPVLEDGRALAPGGELLMLNAANVHLDLDQDEQARALLDRVLVQNDEDKGAYPALAVRVSGGPGVAGVGDGGLLRSAARRRMRAGAMPGLTPADHSPRSRLLGLDGDPLPQSIPPSCAATLEYASLRPRDAAAMGARRADSRRSPLSRETLATRGGFEDEERPSRSAGGRRGGRSTLTRS
jgi:hypothetical protein